MIDQLSEVQIHEIDSRLPVELAALKNQHPVAISLAADYYHMPPFPAEYEPELMEIYFGEWADGPGILYRKDKGFSFDFDFFEPKAAALTLDVDHQVAYIRLGSQIILNRTEAIALPKIPPEIAIYLHNQLL